MNKITILGSGTSTGVPILGCNCQVCQSNDPRNKRLRTSALIESAAGKKILIDASPDLRAQLLPLRPDTLSAVIITHDHADHTHGMDDLRPFGRKTGSPIPVFSDEQTCASLRAKFPYIFQREELFAKKAILGGGIPLLDLHQIDIGTHQVAGEEVEFFSVPHGHTDTLAIVHGKMAYIVDCRAVPESALNSLRGRGLDLLVIDCLRAKPHQTHLHLNRTLEYIQVTRPKLAVLTHMGHEWDHLALTRELEGRGVKNVLAAVDGQSFLYS